MADYDFLYSATSVYICIVMADYDFLYSATSVYICIVMAEYTSQNVAITITKANDLC
jgi:hypothetical protein